MSKITNIAMKLIGTLVFVLLIQHSFAQRLQPIKSVPQAGKAVALTFDDGIRPEIHSQMLDILRKENVQVTFYPIGDNSDEKKLIKRTIKEGHEIGNHSMSHPVLISLSDEELTKEIVDFQDKFKEEFGYTPKTFRAPKLKYDDRVMKVLVSQNLVPVNASVGTRDYAKETTEQYIYETATTSPKLDNGRIILMHEVQKTLNVLPDIIKYYKEQGFKFLTVSQMLELRPSD
ncbi:polysaccharide deacetylase family protein [Reichenbachiella versicolor]|uniref:polysaccharide deacetylase family protein n=1 Tax=Reichenbachiella versicolor TaxID=1821036 RepID=UPI000D6E4A24|nr:polysaccharide deacetylase family protein [Reichenbachiella versicolor]